MEPGGALPVLPVPHRGRAHCRTESWPAVRCGLLCICPLGPCQDFADSECPYVVRQVGLRRLS